MTKLRSGDSAENPRDVETVRRRGDRSLFPVNPAADQGAERQARVSHTHVGLVLAPMDAAPPTIAALNSESANHLASRSLMHRLRSSRLFLASSLITFIAAGRHSEAKQMFEDSMSISQPIGDRSKEASALSGMGRTLRLEGDLDGARRKEEEARFVFAEIGDRAQEAQQTIALEDVRGAASGSQRVGGFVLIESEFSEQTKTERDAVMADLVQAQALVMEGSPTEARLFIAQAIKIAQTSHDRELELSARVMAARMQAASKNPADLNEATRQLDAVLTEATAGSFEAIALETRLAIGQIELNSHHQSSGRARLSALEKEADRRGFRLVARKAAAALHVAHDQASGHPSNQDSNRGLPRSARA